MNTVLYYPHLFPPADWLRLAALCWDEVHTLRPAGSPEIPDQLAELDAALGGILRTADVSETSVDPQFLEMFKKWLQDTMENGQLTKDKEGEWFAIIRAKMAEPLERLLYEHGLARYGDIEIPVRVARWEKATVEGRRGEWVRTRIENPRSKLYRRWRALLDRADATSDEQESEQLSRDADHFYEKNLVKAIQHVDYTFLPQRIAFNYISLLSSKVADDCQRDVATTDDEFAGILFHDVRNTRGALATAVLQANLPRDFGVLDPHRLAEFRSEFAASRLKYQAAIQELISQFEKVSSEDTLGRIRREIVEIAKERIKETDITYKKGRFEIVSKSLALTLTPPALAATLASALHIGLFAPAGIAAALSLFAVQTILERRKAKMERARTGWSYVFDVRQKL
jgi:hypothetical protein